MRQSTLLIVNTGATYARMVATFGLGLATTALAIRAVGEDDFGLYGVVYAAIGLVALLTDGLNASVLRHLAHAIGQQDRTRLIEVLSTMLALLTIGAVLLGAVCLVLAQPILSTLTIPEGREDAAWWTLVWVVAGTVVTTIGSPFRSLLVARQSLIIVTLSEVAESVLRLGAAVAALLAAGDGLLVFAAGTSIASAGVTTGLAALCLIRYPDLRPRPAAVRRSHLRPLVSFAGWDTVAQGAWKLRILGRQILLNTFGTAANAANSIATQVATYQGNLASQMARAAQPAITAAEARGDRATVHKLVVVASKYMVLAMTFIAVPVLLETNVLLTLWLGEYPAHTVSLVRLTVAAMTLLWLTHGHMMALYAHGDLRNVILGSAAIELGAFAAAAAWIFLLNGPPEAAPITLVVGTVALNVMQAVAVGRLIDLPWQRWCRRTIVPITLVAGAATAAGLVPRLLLEPGIVRLGAVGAASAAVAAMCSWRIGMEAWEREHFVRVVRAAVERAAALMPARSA